MGFFGIAVIWLYMSAVNLNNPNPMIVLIEIQLLTIIAIIGLCFICVKLWEQNKEIMERLFEEDVMLSKLAAGQTAIKKAAVAGKKRNAGGSASAPTSFIMKKGKSKTASNAAAKKKTGVKK